MNEDKLFNDPEILASIEETKAKEQLIKEKIKSVSVDNAAELLKYINDNCDTEMAHVYADRVLCMLLGNLGYDEIVNAYENIEKWYA